MQLGEQGAMFNTKESTDEPDSFSRHGGVVGGGIA